MPKARVRIPLEIEISQETADTLTAAGDIVQRARDAGLPEAIGRLARAFRRARANARRPRR